MSANKNIETFIHRVLIGRKFEQRERAKWTDIYNGAAEYEKSTQWMGKRGRIDIRLIDLDEEYTIVVEIKASNWDKMKPHRVRPNALRHARQIWRYIEAELTPQSVIPAIIYHQKPRFTGRAEEVELILNERLIQVVWRDDEYESLA